MTRLAPRSTACLLLLATAALSTACSNNPLAPRAATAVRAPNPSAGPVRSSGYAVSWTKDGGNSGTSTNGGYAVSWMKDGGNSGASTNGGYAVSWAKDGGAGSQ